MYTLHYIIWIPALVFQRSFNISFSQGIEENTKKSSLVDHECYGALWT